MVNLASFGKPENCGQTVLPDMSLFNKTKIDEKCQHFKKRHFWVIFKQYESSFWNTAVLTFGIFRIFLLGGIFFQSEMMIVTLLTMPDCKTAKSTVHAVMSEECLHRYFKMNRIVCVDVVFFSCSCRSCWFFLCFLHISLFHCSLQSSVFSDFQMCCFIYFCLHFF